MNIFITGGTGLIGSNFIRKFQHKYHFDVFTRQKAPIGCYFSDPTNIRFIHDLKDLVDLNAYDAVINLAGEPIVNKRWSVEQKRIICHSRWDLTNDLSKLFNDSSQPPKVFISGSAIGYYGRQGDEHITESFTQIHPEFSHKICKVWEDKALLAQNQTRVCLLRTGIVLDKEQGALKKMLPLYKFGLGGQLSWGKQYMSWIHIKDMVNAIDFLLHNEQCQGAFNLTSPQPVSNAEFSQTLAQVLKRPNLATMPAFVLRLIMGEMSDLVIFGQRVLPERLLNHDFHFQYCDLDSALNDILNT